jgi:predicted O-methyltransferase YrrM
MVPKPLPMATAVPQAPLDASFSLSGASLARILREASPLGHHEDAATLNLGFGFLYYALVRSLRPGHVVVIGSGYGFSVVCLALGLKDNAMGTLTFVDPSYSVIRNGPFRTLGGTNQWADPAKVRAHFGRFGVAGIVTHHRLTSAEFFSQYDDLRLPSIDVAFIDGNHAYDEVRADFLNAMGRAGRGAYVLLHDTNIYVREFVRHAGVNRWLNVLRAHPDQFELVDFPFSSGVAIVRIRRGGEWQAPE